MCVNFTFLGLMFSYRVGHIKQPKSYILFISIINQNFSDTCYNAICIMNYDILLW